MAESWCLVHCQGVLPVRACQAIPSPGQEHQSRVHRGIDPYRFIAGCSIGNQAVFFSPGPGEVPDAEYHDVSR